MGMEDEWTSVTKRQKPTQQQQQPYQSTAHLIYSLLPQISQPSISNPAGNIITDKKKYIGLLKALYQGSLPLLSSTADDAYLVCREARYIIF
jgi:hypothetical protein